jgi:hypothetical protein
MPAANPPATADDFAVMRTTGFNKRVFQFVESKGLP